ncbi:efflux transporter outer membrane subunit [Acetobacter estunensis]|uniref:efflux transporter outer membrane subunit n=1 Tax=Acetobacter estunensis TaxID=104097 RepID=UPI001C2D6AA7|nr:efflux transporter outer membrane subunit [Acetobacter estunensis]MBV1837256.1 efflux transporter outer membrane subunit [Acetobacter estunensis]
MKISLRNSAGVCAALALSGCDLAPRYEAPHFVVPENWTGQAPFAQATPADAQLPTDWWHLFGDPVLDGLEARAIDQNADLQAAAERFVQARALVMRARADLLPHVGLAFGASDNKQSADALFRYKGATTQTDEFYGGLVSWEPDLWSEIRNQVRMSKYAAQQKAAEFAGARLSLEAEVASDYIALRGYDAQDAIYRQSIAYYQKAVDMTRTQLENQAAPRLDLARAENRLYVAQAAELDVRAQREVAEHAIAVLTNTAPESFHIDPAQNFSLRQLEVPTGVPSELLQRRPDIAAAERVMAQANRSIGVARAAFYPHISLHADGGFHANGFDLAKLANSAWSYGATASMPIFEGGLRRAALQYSWAAYRETRDDYRSTVLAGFREVEDEQSRMHLFREEDMRLKAAVHTAMDMQDMTMTLYKGGLSNYLDSIVAQEAALDARIAEVQVAVRSVQASVGLIRALGGGWNDKVLPSPDDTMTFDVFQYDHLHHPEPAGGISSVSPQKFENLVTGEQGVSAVR